VSRTRGTAVRLALITALLLFGVVQAAVAADTKTSGNTPVMTPEIQAKIDALARRMTVLPQQREAAAENRKLLQRVSSLVLGQGVFGAPKAAVLSGLPGPGGQPDYFGFTPNWAFSPLMRKFVDTLPGLGAGAANNLGNYIPVAKPDTITYPGSDYYEIELRQYTQKLHVEGPPGPHQVHQQPPEGLRRRSVPSCR
jgi:hypothetical protein